MRPRAVKSASAAGARRHRHSLCGRPGHRHPEAEQGKLFQRFYRVDSSLRRSTQGAGLGLFLCRAIIEAHGGRIWLRSEPGKGTTVFFTLPLGEEE